MAGLKSVTEHFWALLMAWPGRSVWIQGFMCTQEYTQEYTVCQCLSFVLSPGAQLQTQGFVGSGGCVCRCVTHVCCFWDPGPGR